MIDIKNVGNQILMLRKRNGFTQDELAEKYYIAKLCKKSNSSNILVCYTIHRKEEIIMDLLRRMSQALDYIEENLTYEIDYETVAQKACCSSYNFQRMFSFMSDVTLAEYIRRRRLTQAALELQNSDIAIVDLAVKYGYESSAAFSRAFALLHGVKPSSARKEGVALQAYPKISFQISILRRETYGVSHRKQTGV